MLPLAPARALHDEVGQCRRVASSDHLQAVAIVRHARVLVHPCTVGEVLDVPVQCSTRRNATATTMPLQRTDSAWSRGRRCPRRDRGAGTRCRRPTRETAQQGRHPALLRQVAWATELSHPRLRASRGSAMTSPFGQSSSPQIMTLSSCAGRRDPTPNVVTRRSAAGLGDDLSAHGGLLLRRTRKTLDSASTSRMLVRVGQAGSAGGKAKSGSSPRAEHA